jgi:hypothetical protein
MKRSTATAAVLLVGAAPFGIVTASAHHGWSSYDSANTLNLTGSIKESGYEHPHGFVALEVPASTTGGAKVWRVVLAPPSRMENRGLSREMLKPGTAARVVGYPHRMDAEEMRAERITVAGKTVELR